MTDTSQEDNLQRYPQDTSHVHSIDGSTPDSTAADNLSANSSTATTGEALAGQVQTSKLDAEGSKFKGMGMFILIALVLHIPLFIYPVLRLCGWLALPMWLTLTILVPIAGSQTLSRIYLRHNHAGWAGRLRVMADFCLGLSPIILILLLCAEVMVAMKLVAPAVAALAVLTTGVFIGLAGSVVASVPMVRTVKFNSEKLSRPVRIVQITDVHIGSRSKGFLDRVIAKVNLLAPDMLCITGDFIDTAGIGVEQLVALKSVTVPVYYCTGNHEKYEDFEDILERLHSLGVVILRDQSVHHQPDLQVIGVDDMEDAMQVKRQLARLTIDPEAFVLLLYHRPRGLEAAAEAGVDLMLSGHTHNGQIFPFNLIVKRVFDRIKGLYQIGKTRLYVSQGTGTWGPVMRVGTRSEITLFEIANNK